MEFKTEVFLLMLLNMFLMLLIRTGYRNMFMHYLEIELILEEFAFPSWDLQPNLGS